MVLAKRFKELEDETFRDILRQAALQCPDRIRLYEYLHYEDTEEQVVTTANESSDQRESGSPVETSSAAEMESEVQTEDVIEEEIAPVVYVEEIETTTDLADVKDQVETVDESHEIEVEPKVNEQVEVAPDEAHHSTSVSAVEEGVSKAKGQEELIHAAARKNVTLEEKHTFLEWLDILEGRTSVEDLESRGEGGRIECGSN